jgi:hypothetical protein
MNKKLDFKAFDDGGADEFLRETMAGHRIEPKPGIWKGISRKLLWTELIHLNFTNLSPKYWIAGTVGLLMLATTLYFGFPGAAPDIPSPKPSEKTARVDNSASNPIVNPSVVLSSNTRQTSVDNTEVAPRPGKAASKTAPVKPAFEATQQPLAYVPEIQKGSKGTSSDETLSQSDEPGGVSLPPSVETGLATTSEITRIFPFKASLQGISPGCDTIITISTATGSVKFRKDAQSPGRFFSANLGVTPEIAFYAEPEEYSKANFWFDGGVTYHISRFSVASGFGLGYVFDEGKYRVDYKSRDSVGYFNSVVSYSVGENSEIIYNTQTVKVYDSLHHTGDSRTRNRYAYLQVPLLFGYRIFESNTTSLTFQAGPAVSFLLGSRKSDPVINYSNATIVRIDDETPSRIQTNWQLWANLYFEMRMNKQVSIYLQPSFKYFLKPMVEEENIKFKAPWTIGLGVGIQFNFGQKKTSP